MWDTVEKLVGRLAITFVGATLGSVAVHKAISLFVGEVTISLPLLGGAVVFFLALLYGFWRALPLFSNLLK